MNNELLQAFEQIEQEKGISRDEIIKMVEASLAAAFRKDYGERNQNVSVVFSPETMGVRVYDRKTVVHEVLDPQKEILFDDAQEWQKGAQMGDIVEREITPKETLNFGRIAAQTAKQVIIQRLREAERTAQFSDLKSKERSIQNAIVQKIEADSVVVDLGKSVGVMFPSEQIKGERYTVGNRIKVFILHVEPGLKGLKITVSRSHPDFIRKLFELEIPEIETGSVEIKAIAREAGSRSKVAVIANVEGIDPIGACIGQKGSRVQSIMNELGTEKVDIIPWDLHPEKFIANALAPAKVLSVNLDENSHEALVLVSEDQLSLAIGKAGQNARLAARLTGWNIDIKADSSKAPTPEESEGSAE